MKKTLTVLLSLFTIDIIFILCGFDTINLGTIFRVLMTDLCIGLLLNLIKDKKKHKITSIIIISIFALYAFIQLEFKNFVGAYYSLKAVSNGIGGAKGYIWYFIISSKLKYYLVFLGVAVFILCDKYLNEDILSKYIKKLNISEITKVVILTNIITLTFALPLASTSDDLVMAYRYHDNYDMLLNNIGPSQFFFKDFFSLLFPRKYEFQMEEDEIIEEEKNNSNSYYSSLNLNPIEIDDTKWQQIMNKEEDTSIKNIDEYLISLNKNHSNEYTDMFKGYNFIYILTESLDFMAIDEDLTPTLYKMWNNGYHFTNHYSPIYSCATGDSEFTAMTSIYPYRSVCTPYEVLDTNLETSLAGLFKQEGYTVKAYHNWTDQFYKRSKLEYAYGFEDYKDFEQLKIKAIKGWQSDVELVNKALPEFINEDRFFTFLITSSMHWPYDEDSNLGNKYISEINKYHKDYPIEVKRYLSKSMEFDRALETLLKSLEEAGKLDNTVISFFSDHRPFKFESDIFKKYSTIVDRNKTYGNYLTPFVIYNSKLNGEEINNVCSTIDNLPTIANLFGLNYDPRLYMGKDAFTDECIVVMNNLDWITNKGSYKKSTDKASTGITDEYKEKINAHIKNMTNISKTILDYDYFKLRKEIIYPTYKEITQ